MRKLLLLVSLTLVVFIIGWVLKSNILPPRESLDNNLSSLQPTVNVVSPVQSDSQLEKIETNEARSIFIPYWAELPENSTVFSEYVRLIYFGVTANVKGVVKDDPGYKKLPLFITAGEGKRKWLTLRMTNTETNLSFLGNKDSWKKAVGEVIEVVKKNDFQGLALDLEISAVAFTDLKNQVNNFIQYLFRQVKKEDISFAVILYGDTIYRKRPFDLQVVNQFSDEVMIMVYGFHKSRGEPGPNFPLEGKEKYGYDMKSMIVDFAKFVPGDKITVIFGMFGYDWPTDEEKRPIKQAQAITLNQAKARFVNNCRGQNCVLRRDKLSREMEVNYTKSETIDGSDYIYHHTAWFEDEKSVEAKKRFLQGHGVKRFVYWAWGYF